MRAAWLLAWAAVTGGGLAGPGAVRAEEFPGSDAAAEFEKGFGEESGITVSDKDESERDRLRIGGSLWSEFFYARPEGPASSNTFLNQNSLWLYLDSRLKNDIRAYVKAKGVYEPTLPSETVTWNGQARRRLSGDLEELKLLFNVDKKVFFTLGKQKIKWGAARFWNPTDFINTMKRDLLYSDDRRPGVSVIKTHVPLGKANFYLVNTLDGASKLERFGHALRAELPVGPAEVALTVAKRQGSKPLFGVDFSTALLDLDVYSEVAFSAGSDSWVFGPAGPVPGEEKILARWTAGVSYDYQYSDNDTVSFAVEHFLNPDGYSGTADYVWPMQAGAYLPYFLARRYGMFSVYLPNPGSLQNVAFSLLNLLNLTDGSGLTKLSVTFTGLTGAQDLKLDLGLAGHYGDPQGELRLGRQLVDASVRLMVDF